MNHLKKNLYYKTKFKNNILYNIYILYINTKKYKKQIQKKQILKKLFTLTIIYMQNNNK